MQKVMYYSKPDCELCEEGLVTLKLVQEDIPFHLEIINIEENDEIHEKYMLMIPVAEYAGEILQYGRLDYVTLVEALSE
ncbi:glutaredoxin family protein [Solibacillus sp. CAU 1738]|uniref:glutaredoxin family protein n=1 Tax=Solibacillus sp. CAU 1738 TaxID=3140363 RepID=UPI0032604BBD